MIAPTLVVNPPPSDDASAVPGSNPILTVRFPAADEPTADRILADMKAAGSTPLFPTATTADEISTPIPGRMVSPDTAPPPVAGALVPQVVQAALSVPPVTPTQPTSTPADLKAIEDLKQVPPTPPSTASKLADDAIRAVQAGAVAAGASLVKDLVNKPITNLGQSVLDVINPQASPRVVSSATASNNFWLYLAIGIGAVIFLTKRR